MEAWYAKNAGLIGLVELALALVALAIAIGAIFFQDEWKRRFKDVPRERRTAVKIRDLRYRRLLVEAFQLGMPTAHVLLLERLLLFFRSLVGVFLGVRVFQTLAVFILARGHVGLSQLMDHLPQTSRLGFEACLAYAIWQCGSALNLVNDIMLPKISLPKINAELVELGYVDDARASSIE